MTDAAAPPVVFSMILRPHRSGSRRGIRIVIGLVAGIWGVVGIVFALVGAWPVFGFLGLEVLLLYAALHVNLRDRHTFEAIDLTATELTVRRVNHWGQARDWSFPAYWLQVNMDDPPRPRSHLELRSHGRSLVIGAFLMPRERLEAAHAIRHALRTVKEDPSRA